MLLSSPFNLPKQELIDTMGLNYFASSTPVVVPHTNANHFANQHHHHPDAGAVLHPSPSAFQSPAPARKYISKHPKPPSLNYLARSSNGVAGRKRSRDDSGEDHSGDDELEACSRPIVCEAIAPRPEPVLGPGMTLVYPDQTNLNISPESQSGTWMEEKADETDGRPRMVARKSQRRVDGDFSYNATKLDPIVLHLGIGWKRLSDAQASAISGSETFIRNQFSVDQPRILLHHEGLGIYVVRTEPKDAAGYWSQWWLFREDLKSCRFLCNQEEDLYRRLSNKRQDERGNWLPDILAEGPEVFAKDVAAGGRVLPPSPGFAAISDAQQQMQPSMQPSGFANGDVEMEM